MVICHGSKETKSSFNQTPSWLTAQNNGFPPQQQQQQQQQQQRQTSTENDSKETKRDLTHPPNSSA